MRLGFKGVRLKQTFPFTTICQLLDGSIGMATSQGNVPMALEIQTLSAGLKSFREKWAARYKLISEKRAEMLDPVEKKYNPAFGHFFPKSPLSPFFKGGIYGALFICLSFLFLQL